MCKQKQEEATGITQKYVQTNKESDNSLTPDSCYLFAE